MGKFNDKLFEGKLYHVRFIFITGILSILCHCLYCRTNETTQRQIKVFYVTGNKNCREHQQQQFLTSVKWIHSVCLLDIDFTEAQIKWINKSKVLVNHKLWLSKAEGRQEERESEYERMRKKLRIEIKFRAIVRFDLAVVNSNLNQFHC